jgi:hypothetical protein
MRARCVQDIALYGEYHRYLPDILMMRGWKVGEHPIAHHPRHSGYSKYPWTKGPRAMADLCAIAFTARFGDRPMQAFGTMGLWLIILGAVAWIIARFADIPALNIASIIILIVGIQSILFGLAADMLARAFFTARKPYVVSDIKKNAAQ